MGAPLGNKNAVKGFPFREAVNEALEAGDHGSLRDIARTLVSMAASGDLDAIKELANRLDGRPGQRVEVDVHDSSAARMQEAEDRLQRYRAGSLSAEIQTQLPAADEPDYLQ